MKKLYQIPSTTVVRVETHQMIAASENMVFGSGVESAAGAESRRGGDFWDDEDE